MNRRALLALLLCAAMTLAGCAAVESLAATRPQDTAPPTTAAPTTAATPVTQPPTAAPTTEPPRPITLRITAVGDILLHNSVSNSCKKGDSFDFTPLFTHVKPVIEGSDIAFVNQEVMLTGEVRNYPLFAAPYEVADALIDTGFNVINLATNHTMDRGESGLAKCITAVSGRPFEAVLGVFETEDAAGTPILLEKQGVTFGFLSYTYGLNGLAAPAGKPWMISVLDGDSDANAQRLSADIAALRPLCDYLIVSMHWGAEYQSTPTGTQQKQAQLLCDLGVDLIIGHHPHVLQPLEWLESQTGHQTLCMYSLGNFVSNQQRYDTMLGGLLEVELTFDPQSLELLGTDAGVYPLVTHYASGSYTTYFLEDYTPELARAHGIERSATAFSVDYLEKVSQTVLGDARIQVSR